MYYGNINFRPPLFEKIIKNLTHRGLRNAFCFLLNIKYWKTFGEYKYYLKKSTKTPRKSNRKTTYFSAVSFNKLKPFSFILSLFTSINLLHKTQLLLLFFPRDEVRRTLDFFCQKQIFYLQFSIFLDIKFSTTAFNVKQHL